MRLFFVPLLLCSLLLAACEGSNDAGKNNPAAVVDMQRLVRDSEPGKAAQLFLEQMQKEFNEQLVKVQEKAQKNPEDVQSAQELQGLYMSLQQRLQTEEQNVDNVLLEHVIQVIRAYRAKNGLSMIIRSEAAMDYDKALDVTDALLGDLNNQKIEFKAVTKEQPAPAKADPAPEAKAAPVAPEAAPVAPEAAAPAPEAAAPAPK